MIHNASISDVIKKSQQGRSSSIGRHWSRASDAYKDEQLDVQELQQLLGENVNSLVRFYYKNFPQDSYLTRLEGDENGAAAETESVLSSSPTKRLSKKLGVPTSPRYGHNLNSTPATLSHPSKQQTPRPRSASSAYQNQTLNQHLFGERQLFWTLHHIFYFGFKNRGRSSFRKQVFLWDYLLRVQCELRLSISVSPTTTSNNANTSSPHSVNESISPNSAKDKLMKEKFINLIDSIGTKGANLGKDGKFMLFLIIALRDHLLSPHFVRILSKPSLAQHYYEANSFLRDLNLITFLLQILNTFNEMKLLIDPSLTKGL